MPPSIAPAPDPPTRRSIARHAEYVRRMAVSAAEVAIIEDEPPVTDEDSAIATAQLLFHALAATGVRPSNTEVAYLAAFPELLDCREGCHPDQR